ncbi:hypothetical protein EJ06DRAFT_529958 [Trichodelitschia bisporula]|uniref:Secreted protein n=1 Tax=Trichodelitschia bisporula TaxID=703511 RepID=A0A6G1HXS7_9PEZI|nr:hypothetical protein EJ06DRAFT_529958 [Trichodelitschia bisporula]
MRTIAGVSIWIAMRMMLSAHLRSPIIEPSIHRQAECGHWVKATSPPQTRQMELSFIASNKKTTVFEKGLVVHGNEGEGHLSPSG